MLLPAPHLGSWLGREGLVPLEVGLVSERERERERERDE